MIVSIALAFSAAWASAWGGTALVRALLLKRQVLDRPNNRSSHAVPVPRGAGLAVTPVVAVGWVIAAGFFEGDPPMGWAGETAGSMTAMAGLLGIMAIGLAAVSFADDLRGLPAAVRLLAQGAAVVTMLWMFPISVAPLDTLLPRWAELTLLGVFWLWFVNLFNFMDGIDGLAGVETIAIGAGVAAVALLTAGPTLSLMWGAIAAGAAVGFLIWNWAPARIFLGDVGSVPLGFLLGWLLLDLASRGPWAAALIIPLYYILDATLTLGRRAVRGERIWQAHREHFYQQAVGRGASHGDVSKAVLAANVCLIGLAVLSATGWVAPGHALALSLCLVGGLLFALARWHRRTAVPGARVS
jgi:UDP-N-acetylmuramyl pentapeptide phosphotransferase/UDP-N-acetylglucosamine-1-phosphate transferase